MSAIDALVERSLAHRMDAEILLIDEVGKMECHSVALVPRCAGCSAPLGITVAECGGGFSSAKSADFEARSSRQ